MLLRFFPRGQGIVDQSAFGTSGALSPSAGGRRSLAAGSSGVVWVSVAGTPRRSMTEDPADFCADMMVSAIEVQIKQIARNHVTLLIAVAAERPLIAPPPPPPPLPMPRPPPSDRCKRTIAIRLSDKRRWTIRTTFSMKTHNGWLYRAVCRQECGPGQGRIFAFVVKAGQAGGHGAIMGYAT